jgi:hypothetical protein
VVRGEDNRLIKKGANMTVRNVDQRPRNLALRMFGLAVLVTFLGVVLSTRALAQEEAGALEFHSERGPESYEAPAAEVWIQVTRDTFVSSNQPNTNFGSDQSVRFGFAPNGLGAMRPMLFFDLRPHIPSGARIRSAELHVFVSSIRPGGDSGRGFAAHSLAQSWGESAVTWNSMPQWGSELGRGNLASSGGWQVTNITGLVNEWNRNPGGNNGVILIGDERPDQDFDRAYYSKESTTGLFPRLRVQFDASVDDRAPAASVTSPSPGSWSPANFTVRWQGSDPTNSDGSPGSGIRWFDVYYSRDGGNQWIIGRAQVTTTETQAVGAPHLQRYDFYARARDNAGNEGQAPNNPSFIQTWTRIDAEPPNATVNPLPEFTSAASFPVSWQDTKEGNESGIASYEVQFRANGGPWTILVYNTPATSTTFTNGQNGVLYEFRARGIDNVGNQQPWVDGPQASTTVFLEPGAYIVPFNPALYQKLDGPEVGDGFTVSWEGVTPPGTSITSFDVRFRRPNSSTWLSWLNGTQQTSAQFTLDIADPDGSYVFQVRARNSQGVTGQFIDDLQQSMYVNRHAPFIVPQTSIPFIVRMN